MTDDGFVNVSTHLGRDYLNNPSTACEAGFQCVAKDPYDAIPESDNDNSKIGGCCQKCLNGQSCPPMTVAASGYYFDNLCPDGFRCEKGEWPEKCPPGLMCSKGVTVNCTDVVERARGTDSETWIEGEQGTEDGGNSTTKGNATNSTQIPR